MGLGIDKPARTEKIHQWIIGRLCLGIVFQFLDGSIHRELDNLHEIIREKVVVSTET
jgi:hypothetical protein